MNNGKQKVIKTLECVNFFPFYWDTSINNTEVFVASLRIEKTRDESNRTGGAEYRFALIAPSILRLPLLLWQARVFSKNEKEQWTRYYRSVEKSHIFLRRFLSFLFST